MLWERGEFEEEEGSWEKAGLGSSGTLGKRDHRPILYAPGHLMVYLKEQQPDLDPPLIQLRELGHEPLGFQL